MAVSLGLIAASNNLPLMFVAVTLLAVSNSISAPVLAGLISKKTPDNEQGNIAGMNQSVGGMARLIGPVVGTLLYSEIGLKAPYLAATGILAVTALWSVRHLAARRA